MYANYKHVDDTDVDNEKRPPWYMSSSLSSLNGFYRGGVVGVTKGDTRSLDYRPLKVETALVTRTNNPKP